MHASLATVPQRDYWGPEYPICAVPTDEQIGSAATLLKVRYLANRLYLIYHEEIPIEAAKAVFRSWKQACGNDVEIVPTLVLRMYDAAATPVFDVQQLEGLVHFFRHELQVSHVAIYDIYPNRDQGPGEQVLSSGFPGQLLRVGIQPEEQVPGGFVGAVQDTWTALSLGKTNLDWEDAGFGRDLLRSWIALRHDSPKPIVWDLITVAWDYTATDRGTYPGYDDAGKNMELPEGRNRLAAAEIMSLAKPGDFSGFSSDLFILQVNSLNDAHDGFNGSFYETLKRGEAYTGYYSAPLMEIAQIYRALQKGGPIVP